jgi:predicted naringenin-chalcone synthase
MKAYVTAIGTAVPQYKSNQMDIAKFMSKAHNYINGHELKLQSLYKATSIETRYSVLKDYSSQNGNSFFPNSADLEPFPTTGDRMKVYKSEALNLSKRAIEDCIARVDGAALHDITHLITISCTGMYAPGLDIELIHELGLPSDTKRTAINFMGCYAAINGLKVADAICRSDANAKVLMVAVELCTIHFQKEATDDNLFANALFADGAAAVLIEGTPRRGLSLSMEQFVCELDANSSDDMAWAIGNYGFEMKLSAYVPKVIQNGISQLSANLLDNLQKHNIKVDYYAIHPGGKKIVDVIEAELQLTPEDTAPSREVLKNYGNMSSPTVLFVLRQIMNKITIADNHKHIMSFAFGPGLTLEGALLEIHYN